MKEVIGSIKEAGKKLGEQSKEWAKKHPVLAVIAGLLIALGVAWLVKKIANKFNEGEW